MAKSTVELECPHCGARYEFEPVTQLGPNSPHLKALVSGTLNCVECPECHTRLNVPVRLIYRDAQRPYLLVQEKKLPTAAAQQELLRRIDEEATAAAADAGVERPVVRVVWSRPEFIEKLFLHEKNLDDRIIEYAKFQLFNGGADGQIDPAKHDLLYDFTQKNAEDLVFIVFDRAAGRPVRVLQVPMEEFRNLEEEFLSSPVLQKELDRAFPSCLVTVETLLSAKHAEI